MLFKVLVDNNEGLDPHLQSEHGLSIYFEMDGFKWLLDVGASGKFAENAEVLGVDISDVDYLILSHAHADHTGGLSTFLQLNSKAKVFLSAKIDGRKYYSTRRGGRRDISIDYNLLSAYPDRFELISENTWLSPSVWLLTHIPDNFAVPKANATLYADDKKDDFSHEIAVVVEESSGKTILSSCSHHGLLNTLSAVSGPVHSYIGGLHLVNSNPAMQAVDAGSTNSPALASAPLLQYETPKDLAAIAETIRQTYPGLTIYTGHCTGSDAFRMLKAGLGEGIVQFHTGFCSEDHEA